MATHSSILARRIPRDRGAWWATVQRVTKDWTGLISWAQHRCWKASIQQESSNLVSGTDFVTSSSYDLELKIQSWTASRCEDWNIPAVSKTNALARNHPIWAWWSSFPPVICLLPQWVKAFNHSEPVCFRKHQLQGYHLVRGATLALIGNLSDCLAATGNVSALRIFLSDHFAWTFLKLIYRICICFEFS